MRATSFVQLWAGIGVTGSNITIQGNIVGLNVFGTGALATTPQGPRSLGNGFDGIDILGGSAITVGGAAAGAGNVVSNNNHALDISSGGSAELAGIKVQANGTTVQGNKIGTESTASRSPASPTRATRTTAAAS